MEDTVTSSELITSNEILHSSSTSLGRSTELAHKSEKEEIRMDQIPKENRWCLIPLYKISMTGEMLILQDSME